MKRIQVVIPMAGCGERFSKAGHKEIKPLIQVDQKPIIEHVIALFPKDCDFVFICREEHLKETDLEKTLLHLVPQGQVVSIHKHNLGPVWSLKLAKDEINQEQETIICYCDFAFLWDFQKFHQTLRETKADGAVVCYKGFHPHMLGSTQYAFIKHSEMNILEIREKNPFTSNRLSEYASNGLYYFKSGYLLFQSIDNLLLKDIKVNGEFYVSHCYNELAELGKKSIIYEVDNMFQWGTSEDLKHYQYWSDSLAMVNKSTLNQIHLDQTVTLMLMSGEGKRFRKSVFAEKKPFIHVNNQMMYQSALSYLPKSQVVILVANEQDKQYISPPDLERSFLLENISSGQATSAQLALHSVSDDQHLLIAACDLGMLTQADQFIQLVQNSSTEIICFCSKAEQQHFRNSQDYGWLSVKDTTITYVGVKEKIPHEGSDYIISGTFWFKNKIIFQDLYNQMISQNLHVNNEYYVDTMIQLAVVNELNVRALPLEACLNWGTPEDLQVYQYWQSVLNQKIDHPYCMERDPFFKKSSHD